MNTRHTFWERPNWLLFVLLPLFHYTSIKLTYLFAVTASNVMVVWLPNAVLLAALLRFRGKRAPWLVCLSFGADVLANMQSLPLHTTMLLATINQGEVVLTYTLLMRYGVSPRLHRVQDFLKFGLAGPVFAAMLAGLAASAVLRHFHNVETPYLTLARLWWFSDGLGLFIFTPLLLAFTRRQPTRQRRRLRHFNRFDAAILAAALALTAAVLSARSGAIGDVSITPTLLLPVAGILALRFGSRLTTSFVAAVSMATATMISHGMRPFGNLPAHVDVVRGQEFMLTLGVIGIGFSVLIDELRARERELEARVLERTHELEESNERLKTLSATDGLTGIANRRRFDETLASEWSRARRDGRPLMLAMLDVDLFKQYNDSHGHQAGDEVLRRVAAELETRIRRSGDLVARYGGEEFAIISHASNEDNALAMAELVCTSVAALQLPHPGSPFGMVTVSVGVALIAPQEADSIVAFLRAADMALYRAKLQGRNRVALENLTPAAAGTGSA
ncbi:MAG: diguanylate cyclase [Duganella sp.]